jgi:RHH-type proline utilization regulon transcriptional repressor/proline dehydrogenase/delta 1-pyrroline-5-carboxylate dehydrogenase
VPRFFGPVDRTLMKGFQSFGGYMPGVALPLVKEHMHKETANVILPGEHEVLTRHLDERRAGSRSGPVNCRPRPNGASRPSSTACCRRRPTRRRSP